MKLLTEIVDLLMSEDGSLNEALLKTKVLLHRIGQAELVGWVNSELTGYSSNEQLPDYRKLHGWVKGTITNGYYIYQNHQIPLRQLTEKQRGNLEESSELHSIGVIEKMVSDAKTGATFSIPIEPEICAALSDVLQPGYFIQHASTHFDASQFRQILVEVRSRLLSFVLNLQDELGEAVSDTDAKTAAGKIDVPSIFAGAVFGDNAVIMVGHNGQQHVQNTNVKNDAAALADELRKNGVDEEDIEALSTAIAQDPVPTSAAQYGPTVQGWMKRMLVKAVDGSWNVSVGAAGNVLATVLQKYYGL